MEKAELLEQIAKTLESTTRMISVLAIGIRISEAQTPEEAAHLSRALEMLLERDNIGYQDPTMNGFSQDQSFRM